jgi:hypothetical protein
LRTVAVERMSLRDEAAVAAYFEAGPTHPCIFTDAMAEWPACGKWTFDFFATHYRDAMGVVRLGFDRVPGKMTKLGAFIDHLDDPFSEVPGFWIGPDGKPAAVAPEGDDSAVWSLALDPFNKHPELMHDVSPFPAAIPNLTTALPRDLANVLNMLGKPHYAIYLSRKGTVTTLHFDYHHTFGCLAQLLGEKTFILFEPGAFTESDGSNFDPEHPDYVLHPEMADRTARSGVLAPGEMLIVPPDWWHYARNHDHSITLSHNFFNQSNFAAYMRCIFVALCDGKDPSARIDTIRDLLGRDPAGSPA